MKSLVVWAATLVWLIVCADTGNASSAGCPANLPAGTIIRILSDEKLTAGYSSGPIVFTVSSDVRSFPDGPPLISRGSKVLGRIVDSKEAGRLRGKAMSQIVLNSILIGDSCEYPVEAKILEAGKFKVEDNVVWGRGHAKRDAFALLFPPTTVYELLRIPSRGPKLVIDAETPLTVKLMQPIYPTEDSKPSSDVELSTLRAKVDQLEREIASLSPAAGLRGSTGPDPVLMLSKACTLADLNPPTSPIAYKDVVVRPVRNLTPYHVRLYLNGTQVALLPPCYGPSMVRMPTYEFHLEGVATLLTADGQIQVEVKVVPNSNQNGWDIVWLQTYR